VKPSLVLLLLIALAGCGSSPKAEFLIAAASDLRFAMDELAALFQRRHPDVKVRTIYGSSGHFFAQIQQGAPYDIYCSADISYPRQLVESGHALPGSEFQYAVGRIVLWVPASSPMDVGRTGIRTLLDPAIRHIAIANPDHAPYGKAAVAAMRSLGIYDSVKAKLVYGENVSQTLQYVQQQSADIGIVALSLALAPSVRQTGHYWELPIDSYPHMDQGGIITKRTQFPDLARAFRSFLMGSEAGAILKAFGFYLPSNRT
jgi:molybdate transport system substrate-binding protein